jgi:hypothetical protein
MDLKEQIEDWKKYPNALGSEAQAAILVGSIAAETREDIPENIKSALKILSLRGTMRDIAQAIKRDENRIPRLGTPSFHEVVDSGVASCGISWAEALAAITKYL